MTQEQRIAEARSEYTKALRRARIEIEKARVAVSTWQSVGANHSPEIAALVESLTAVLAAFKEHTP